MIISGGSRCNWRFFARHLTNGEQNERVQITQIHGLTSDTILGALREMDAVASGTRCKNFFYHANINPRYGEHLTPDQWEQAVDTLERNLGLTGHARFVVQHEKEGRVHEHIIWCRIDPDTMTAVSDSFTARDHERTSRELEQAFGLEPVDSVLVPDREKDRQERRPKNWETFRGYGSGIDPQQVKEEVTALWNTADSGSAFAAALAEHGYILCKGDRRDFCIVDAAGNEHSLARRIEGQKAASVRARMEDVDRDALPTVAQGRELALQREDDSTTPPVQGAGAQSQSTEPDAQERSPDHGFWELIADYAADIIEAMRQEHTEQSWTVEETHGTLQVDSPAEGREKTTIDTYAAPMEEAIHETGSIPTRDGQTWWQRAGCAVHTAIDTATTWVKERWGSFVEMVEQSRNRGLDGPDDLDMEL